MEKLNLIFNVILILVFVSCQNTGSDRNIAEKTTDQNNKNIELKALDKGEDKQMDDEIIRQLEEPLQEIVKSIQWFGQDAVKIPVNGNVIYIDPYVLFSKEKADIIFITHAHYDHLSIEDIREIITEETKIYAPKDCCEKLKASGITKCTDVEIGKTINIAGVKISVVPAYNINKKYHPKENNWVGYVMTINGVKIYHPGDTNRIPEMKDFDCDIAFMPLGQTYTMNSVEEAADAVLDVKAKVAIPFHYGMYEGSDDDASKFKELLSEKVAVVIKMR